MKLIVGLKNLVKVNVVQIVMNQVLGNIGEQDVLGMYVLSLVVEQFMMEVEICLGVVNWVKVCMQVEKVDWYIVIEGGVDNFEDGLVMFVYVVICNGEQWFVGCSVNLFLLNSVYQVLVNGEELGLVMDCMFNIVNVK